jgi:hypothetical protein
MHCNRPTLDAGRMVMLCIVSAATMLALTVSPSVKATRASSSDANAEPAPQVKTAVDGIFDLFQQKPVVALGDAHGMAQEEAFYSVLVRDPRFAEQIGNVVVEFGGSSAQKIIDRYVAGEDVPFTELRRVWTDVVGAFSPGEPVPLGLVNFYANVRAVNLKLPLEKRIKVWLGDPEIDWSKINSFRDLQPLLMKRDESVSRIVTEEILAKKKKTLLIIGLGHLFGPGGPGPLSNKITQAYPNALAVVSPFIGYLEPECNAKVISRAGTWPIPSVAGPIDGTWLKSELQLPGCNYIPPARVEQMKKMAGSGPPPGARIMGGGKPPSPGDILAAEFNILSGVRSDAILYLGPPDTLMQSPAEPSLYLDPDYFNQEDRRARCCMPFGGKPLDWDEILQQNSVVPKKFKAD